VPATETESSPPNTHVGGVVGPAFWSEPPATFATSNEAPPATDPAAVNKKELIAQSWTRPPSTSTRAPSCQPVSAKNRDVSSARPIARPVARPVAAELETADLETADLETADLETAALAVSAGETQATADRDTARAVTGPIGPKRHAIRNVLGSLSLRCASSSLPIASRKLLPKTVTSLPPAADIEEGRAD
jgi:hypothetical protein|tara:strand:- start:869 stop:1441 length:573 start_codon:yes stop_codon:yes gene_type:complete